VAGTNDRFISKLDSEYLKNVAKEIGGDYVNGDNVHNVLDAMKKQKPARRDIAPYNLSSVLAGLAALLLLLAYVGKHPLAQIQSSLKFYKKELFKNRVSANEASIAHDNQIN
jgi:mxaL protein